MESIKERINNFKQGNEFPDVNIAQETAAFSSSSFKAALSGSKRATAVEAVIEEELEKVPSETAGKYGEPDGKKFSWHPGFDARFPHMNQTRRCWQNYVDYFRCLSRFGDDKRCEYFKNVYTIICPIEWIEKWDEQRDKGSFPGSLE